MKKKLLAVGVAATLGALAGVSSAAIWGPGPGHTSVGRRSGVWSDGGRSRSKGYRIGRLSPADRVQAKAQQARRQGGYIDLDIGAIVVMVLIVGAIGGVVLAYAAPWVWHAIKPLLHALTA